MLLLIVLLLPYVGGGQIAALLPFVCESLSLLTYVGGVRFYHDRQCIQICFSESDRSFIFQSGLNLQWKDHVCDSLIITFLQTVHLKVL